MVSRDASGALCPRSEELVPGDEEEDTVFESTACLQYFADRYSAEGLWSGKMAAEKSGSAVVDGVSDCGIRVSWHSSSIAHC
jgi:hypothetical protein